MKVKDQIIYQPNKEHRLKRKSSFVVVVLKSLATGVCICCGEPIISLEQSAGHWFDKLGISRQAELNL